MHFVLLSCGFFSCLLLSLFCAVYICKCTIFDEKLICILGFSGTFCYLCVMRVQWLLVSDKQMVRTLISTSLLSWKFYLTHTHKQNDWCLNSSKSRDNSTRNFVNISRQFRLYLLIYSWLLINQQRKAVKFNVDTTVEMCLNTSNIYLLHRSSELSTDLYLRINTQNSLYKFDGICQAKSLPVYYILTVGVTHNQTKHSCFISVAYGRAHLPSAVRFDESYQRIITLKCS